MIDIRVFHEKEAWIEGLANDYIQVVDSIPSFWHPRLCLAGGKTPEPFYQALSRLMVDRTAGQAPVILIPGDERVPECSQGPSFDPADLNETMLGRAFAPAIAEGAAFLSSWFGRKPDSDFGSNTSDELARSMLQTMEARLSLLASPGRVLFDLCYLGLGSDGHTAGLFPGSLGLDDPSPCVRGLAPQPPRHRVSLGFSALCSSTHTRFIVNALGKEEALDRLRRNDPSCPAVQAATADTIAFVLI
jgi:6-phosphogluconolactonase/glucosamine-6-phosphate isomerase/deaminase